MSKNPCKEIVFRKNEVDGSVPSYDIFVMGEPVGRAVRKLTLVVEKEKPKITWVLQLDDGSNSKEFKSVRLVRSHMLHRMMLGHWDTVA
jgi:hypothetical protein